MKKTLLFLAVFTHSVSSMAGTSILELLGSPITPQVQSCNLDDDLKKQCANEMCGNVDDQYPMVVSDAKMRDFVDKGENKIPTEQLKKNEEYIDLYLKSMKKKLAQIKAMTPEQLISDISSDEKTQFITSKFYNECNPVFSQDKPIDQRLTVTCEGLFENNPIKAEFVSTFLEQKKNNLNEALLYGLYTYDEVLAKIPEQKNELKEKITKMKKDNPEGEKDLISYLETHWDTYSTEGYTGQMKFIKAISKMKNYGENEYDLCKGDSCQKFFEQYVRSEDFKKDIEGYEKIITDPAVRETAIASTETQQTIELNGPTEEEMELYTKRKDKAIEDILSNQKQKMSEHSFGIYNSQIKEVLVSYDSEGFKSLKNDQAVLNEDVFSTSMFLSSLASKSPDDIYVNLGASLGSPVMIVSDYYNDPKYKEFDDESFDKTEVKSSLFSIKEPVLGIQILAHELGHHLSHLHDRNELSEFTSKTLSDAKNCIKSRYDGFKATSGKDAGSFYLEEEFADEFGFLINTSDSPALFCQFLIKEANTNELNLSLMTTMDNHPNDLWRSLAQFLQSGKTMPTSCKTLIEQESNNYQYKKCL